MYHLDAYRLSGAAEAWDLDLDTLLESGPLVIEWADRIQSALPAERLWVTLRWADEIKQLKSGQACFEYLDRVLDLRVTSTGMERVPKAGRAVIDWGVYGVPETFIVGRDGTIAFKHVGPINAAILATIIRPQVEKALAR